MSLNKEETENLIQLLTNEDFVTTGIELMIKADAKVFAKCLLEMLENQKAVKFVYRNIMIARITPIIYPKDGVTIKIGSALANIKMFWSSSIFNKYASLLLYKALPASKLDCDQQKVLRGIQFLLKDACDMVDYFYETE